VEEQPDLVEFGDDPGVDEDDLSARETEWDGDDDAASSLCGTARGVCMDHAETNCKAPKKVRRGLCPRGPAHQMCCVSSGEGGQPASTVAPNTVATNANWLTMVGGVRVIRMDRSSRRNFPRHNPTKFVVHTTEGWWPRPGIEGSHSALDGKRVWSHFLIGAGAGGALKVYQYLPLNVASTALKRNNINSIQVEVSALTCCPFTSYDKALTDLTRALFTAVRAAVPGIKNEVMSPSNWARPIRYSLANWQAASGLTGHMFAPVPDDHNDPGAINPSALLSDFAGATATYKGLPELGICLKTKCRAVRHIHDYYNKPGRAISFTN
jgi:hypothetical protein